jgi:radical SAM superfamily enzyme YgiQ (UPF0313 family)/glycosyltransferase involved in cell wall biosynthesis
VATSHHVYVVASEWGGTKGGINVFNKSLVEALWRVVGSDVEVFSVVQQTSLPANLGSSPRFLSYSGDAESLAKAINAAVFASADLAPQSVTIVGHDVHTGGHALGARDILKAKQINCLAAIVCHMEYRAYQNYKERTQPAILTKAEEQQRHIEEADHVFAVGPLLKQAFQRLRTTVHEIIPGFPEGLAPSDTQNPSDALKFFFSGRIDAENDRVKNGSVALRALYEAYSRNAGSSDTRWRQRGTFVAYGFPASEADRSWFSEGLDRARLGTYLTLALENYSDRATLFDQLRDSHIALMPSMHEGFGLSGWEAVCAGIPLICSRHSGLAAFLESRFAVEHDLPQESVLLVGLSGENDDVATLAGKIVEATQNYERRRHHARKLADYLAKHHSWDECARSVASALGLAPMGSPHWQARRHRSQAALARRDDAGEEPLRHASQLAGDGQALNEWSVICTALNYLSDVAKNQNYQSLDDARTSLAQLAKGIEAAYGPDLAQEPQMRCAGRFDVAWRYMAAASNIGTSLKTFVESIPAPMMAEIKGDSFLRRELLHYAMKYSGEFGAGSQYFANNFFGDILQYAAKDPALQTRVARLKATFPSLDQVATLDAAKHKVYSREQDLCAQVKLRALDLNDLVSTSRELGPTALALATLDPTMRERGIDQLFETWEEHGGSAPEPEWRGDKLLRAALLATVVHPEALIGFIEALAEDEEEALRWAAIDLAFSPALRTRLIRASQCGAIDQSPLQLRRRLGAVVDRAVSNGDFHPWMQREFLSRFHREHREPVMENIDDRFAASDFPVARQLFGPPFGQAGDWRFRRLHPEVEASARKLREHLQRILLVLPPISLDRRTGKVSPTSTPPMGLGMVGGQLLAQGHDVYLADCHRTPQFSEIVIADAHEFEWVGFNAVLPTLRSVYAMACAIKRRANSPAVVIGGPAVNARAFSNGAMNDEEHACWDFEIYAKPEVNFPRLVAEIPRQQATLPVGIYANERSRLVIGAGHTLSDPRRRVDTSHEWPDQVRLDRRIFATPQGDYEPQPTRAIDSAVVEAHVVMSRGCDWNCTFCTERREQSGGEQRRPISSVKQELQELARQHVNLRVQFVDDNVLPQLAAVPAGDRVARAKALEWADHFLEVIADIRSQSNGKFGWRGIFRVEDFIAYENDNPAFVERLLDTGCRMLAFGIEHGNEVKRRKMKVGASATNQEFAELFARLRAVGIHSKAYFILGGPKETEASSEETISFAIRSGVSLAYFALYKEFVPAVGALRSEQPSGSNAHSKYSAYEQLDIQWDDTIRGAYENPRDLALQRLLSGVDQHSEVSAEQAVGIYKQLSQLGFRFSDLVKYADHHAQTVPASEVLNKVNFKDQARFEDKVAAAYIKFYLREDFVDTYKDLLANGY